MRLSARTMRASNRPATENTATVAIGTESMVA